MMIRVYSVSNAKAGARSVLRRPVTDRADVKTYLGPIWECEFNLIRLSLRKGAVKC